MSIRLFTGPAPRLIGVQQRLTLITEMARVNRRRPKPRSDRRHLQSSELPEAFHTATRNLTVGPLQLSGRVSRHDSSDPGNLEERP
jgi:hypothetical protein